MKFLVIKDLDAKGQMTPQWTAEMQKALVSKPEALRKDYAKLVESIARLQIIETNLRKEVLHEDTGAKSLLQVAEAYLPLIGGTFFSQGTQLLNMALLGLSDNIAQAIKGKKLF